MKGRQLKLITDMLPIDFEKTVNEFLEKQNTKILNIEYKTTFVGSEYADTTVEYSAFIEYEQV